MEKRPKDGALVFLISWSLCAEGRPGREWTTQGMNRARKMNDQPYGLQPKTEYLTVGVDDGHSFRWSLGGAKKQPEAGGRAL